MSWVSDDRGGMRSRGRSPALVNGRPVSAAAQVAVEAAAAEATSATRAKAMELAIAANPDADSRAILAAAEQIEAYLRTGEQPT